MSNSKPQHFPLTVVEAAICEIGESLFQISDPVKLSQTHPNLAQLLTRYRGVQRETRPAPTGEQRTPSNRGMVTNQAVDARLGGGSR